MSAVEVCPDCDIAGCTHIRNRTGAFAALSQPSVGVDELAKGIAKARPRGNYGEPTEYDYHTAEAILAKYNVTVKG